MSRAGRAGRGRARALSSLCLLSACLSAGALSPPRCFGLDLDAADKLRVFVSIPPQKFLVERIGGDAVDTRCMLRPGYSAELYEPLPGQLAALQEADMYFRIGAPFETHWEERLREREGLTVVDCCAGLVAAVADDPHVWTSPPKMIKLAALVKESLRQKRPRHQRDYERNYARLLEDLEELHRYIERRLRPDARAVKPAIFVVHPAWGHFAAQYGLRQYALEKHHGHVGARSLVELARLARREKAAVLFSQRRHHSAAARAFAQEIGVRIATLDPLAEEYLSNMRHVARQFALAIQPQAVPEEATQARTMQEETAR